MHFRKVEELTQADRDFLSGSGLIQPDVMLPRAVLPVLLVALGATPIADAQKDGWREVTAKDGGFAVKLPGKPHRQRRPDETECTVHFLVYGGKGGRPSFMVSWNDFDFTADEVAQHGGPDALLATARDILVKNAHGDLVEDAAITIGAHPGRDFVIGMPDLGAMMFVRAIVIERRLYQLIYTAMAPKVSDADRRRFATSFRLLDPPP